jgi:CheY-like chemotaxis protein
MPPPGFSYRILVVDDDPLILQTSALILREQGYEAKTASDGFEALVELRRSKPDLIISDLRMPNMSGFELLSIVRRRFPHIPVVAISGEYIGESPIGLIADAFFVKGQYSHEDLFRRIAELIEESPLRPHSVKPDRAPVWIPRDKTGYVVVTCTDCLRSFSVADDEVRHQSEICRTSCLFCGTEVRFLCDLQGLTSRPKLSATDKKKPPQEASG